MSSLSDLFVTYKVINLPDITAKQDNILVQQAFVIPAEDLATKVQNVKTRILESPVFKWGSSGTEKTTYTLPLLPVQQVVQLPTPSLQQQPPIQNNTAAGDTISEEMLLNLHHAEGQSDWTAHAEKKAFGESFVTGPLGMVYKYDSNGNIIGKFREGERVSPEWAKLNARYHYTHEFKEWKQFLAGLPEVTQNKLDALVAASDGTVKSKNKTKAFVKLHWGDWAAIDNFLRTHAVRAAGNGKVQPGLVLRRLFEADWFKGIKKPFSWYLKNRKLFNV